MLGVHMCACASVRVCARVPYVRGFWFRGCSLAYASVDLVEQGLGLFVLASAPECMQITHTHAHVNARTRTCTSKT